MQCERCNGCGKIADTENGEPWESWANLPPGSDLAVRLGFVRPIQCPDCGGTGLQAAHSGGLLNL